MLDNREMLMQTHAIMSGFVVNFEEPGRPGAAPDSRLDAPAFRRNVEPIWNAIGGYLEQQTGDLLEIGSGTGQHAATYAARTPRLTWWPSDLQDSHLNSIESWRAEGGLANLRAPQRIDLSQRDWTWKPGGGLAAMLCFNVVHIAPWTVAENLMAGGGRLLRPEAGLFMYGPFKRDGQHTAPSNETFDAWLRGQDPAWGVRDIGDIERLAANAGLKLADVITMPANNLVLVFTRAANHN